MGEPGGRTQGNPVEWKYGSKWHCWLNGGHHFDGPFSWCDRCPARRKRAKNS